MTKNIFVRKTRDVRETGQSGPATFFLATIDSVSTTEGVTIIPDGQITAVQKKYKCLTGAGLLAEGDRVVVMKHSGTCVVLGKIGMPSGDGDDKVSKSGDTMTGALIMYGADINLRSTTNTIGTVPDTSQSDRHVYFRDKLNTILGKLQSVFMNDGRVGMQLGAQRTINGSSLENNLALTIDANGDRFVNISSAVPWRKALGLGTSGALPITAAQGGTGAETAAGHAVFAGPNASSAGAPSFRALVADDLPAIPSSKLTGTVPVDNGGTGAATAAGHAVFVGPNASSAGAPSFRALVAADIPTLSFSKLTGTLPISKGGTGATGTTTTAVGADIFTIASGFKNGSANFASWGKVAMLRLSVTASAAITTNIWHTVATLTEGKGSAQTLIQNDLNGRRMQLSGRTLQVYGTVAQDEVFTFYATYLMA